MKRTVSCLITVLLMLLQVAAFAQVSPIPPAMNFQGRLTRPDGTPVPNGNYAIRFSLWDAASAGTEKWNQTFGSVAVKNGTLAIQFLNVPSSAFATNLWLEIKMGADAPLTPRQQLVSVAYAMKANSIRDRGVTTLSLDEEAVTSAKILDGTVGNADLALDAASLNKVSGNNLTIGGNRLFVTNGVIQKGGSPVTSTLDLGLYSQVAGGGMRFVTNSAPFQWYTDSGGGTNSHMTLTATGNLGLGNTNPNVRLDVQGGTTNSLRLRNTTQDSWAMLIKNDSTPTEVGGFVSNEGKFYITNDQVTSSAFGTGYAALQYNGTWTMGSDRRLKTDIQPLKGILEKALSLRPVTYFYKGLDRAKNPNREIGFIAQEVEPFFPEFVYRSQELRSLNYAGMSVVAIGAVQELHVQIKKQQEEIDALKSIRAENAELKQRLDSLTAMLQRLLAAQEGAGRVSPPSLPK
jgi:hypothetical protein